MHFIVIFLAIVWIAFKSLSERLEAASARVAYDEIRQEGLQRFNIPPHMLERMDKETFRPPYLRTVANLHKEREIFAEICDELGVSAFYGLERGPDRIPWRITESKEEFMRMWPLQDYETVIKAYPILEKKINEMGLVTTYQIEAYFSWVRKRYDQRQRKKY